MDHVVFDLDLVDMKKDQLMTKKDQLMTKKEMKFFVGWIFV
jgi:hypothetical protein